MGCCSSRHFRNAELNDEEITNELLAKLQICQISEEAKDKVETIAKNIDTLNSDTKDLTLELLTDDIYKFDDEIGENEDDNDDDGIRVPKMISTTSEPALDGPKLQKSTPLTEKYITNPEQCENVHIEDTYLIEEPHYHKRPAKRSFIETPLTADDVIEVLSDKDDREFDNTNSTTPFDSSFISALSDTDDLNSYLCSIDNSLLEENDNFTESDKITNRSNRVLSSSHVTGPDTTRNRAVTDVTIPTWSAFPENICTNGNRRILNAVPDGYDSFRKMQKNNQYMQEKRRAFSDPMPHQLVKEVPFSVLYDVNSKNQNILHQIVLKKDYNGARTILSCLLEMKILNNFLNSADMHLNTPIAYAIQIGDLTMTQILLEYHPVMPTVIFSVTLNECTPTMHVVLKFLSTPFVIGESNNSLFTLICNYVISLRDNDLLSNFLEAKDKHDLTILHYAIVNFEPKNDVDIQNMHFTYEHIIPYLYKIGSSLETRCRCDSKQRIEVDAIGQTLFSRYPREILRIVQNFYYAYKIKIVWNYVIDNITYSLEELFSLRTDVTSETREYVIIALRAMKKVTEAE